MLAWDILILLVLTKGFDWWQHFSSDKPANKVPIIWSSNRKRDKLIIVKEVTIKQKIILTHLRDYIHIEDLVIDNTLMHKKIIAIK